MFPHRETWNDISIRSCSKSDVRLESFHCPFDSLIERLQMLENLYAEWDGSFVWREFDRQQHLNWQMDGVVSDRQGKVACLEVKARWEVGLQSSLCKPIHQLTELLETPENLIVVELAKLGSFVDLAQFIGWHSV